MLKKFLIIFGIIILFGGVGLYIYSNYYSNTQSKTASKDSTQTSQKLFQLAEKFLDDLPIDAKPIGSSVKITGKNFEVSLDSEKYVYFKDYQIPFLWANVKNLSDKDDRYDFRLVEEPTGWMDLDEFAGHIWVEPSKTDSLKYNVKAVYTGQTGNSGPEPEPNSTQTKEVETTLKYKVTSQNTKEELEFSVTLVVYPEISADSAPSPGNSPGPNGPSTSAFVRGNVTDAKTGKGIENAEVSLWLGPTIRLMPYDMIAETGPEGMYDLSCYSITKLEDHFGKYLDIPGYKLVVQKQGYESYVYDDYIKPKSDEPTMIDIKLTPLKDKIDYKLGWEAEVGSPGVWKIAASDNWDRFAVALGKHPDFDDAENLPAKLPYVNENGKILWSKSVKDESWAIDISSDGNYVVAATEEGDKKFYMWDKDGNEVWKKSPSGKASLESVFSDDNKLVATGPSESAKGFVLYDALTGEMKWDFDTGTAGARSATFTRDGKYVLAAPNLHLFDIDGNLKWRRYIAYVPYMIKASNDNSHILVADKGDVVSMYNLDGDLLWRKEHKVITYGAMSDGAETVAILTSQGHLYVYNGDGELLWYQRIPGGTTGECANCSGGGHNGLDITPDGKYILVGGGNYNTILYDNSGNVVWRHTGDKQIDPSEHPLKHSVMHVQISDDTSKLVAGYGYSDPKVLYFEKK